MRGRRRPAFLVVCAVALLGALSLGGAALADTEGDEVDLRAELAGANEVPAADPDGEGRADLEVDVAGGVVCFEVEFTATGTPNRGHIHRGAAGVNGGIVVPFFDIQNAADNRDARHDELELGELERCVGGISTELLGEIAADPAAFYVNLHNARFPGGQIRGQLAQH